MGDKHTIWLNKHTTSTETCWKQREVSLPLGFSTLGLVLESEKHDFPSLRLIFHSLIYSVTSSLWDFTWSSDFSMILHACANGFHWNTCIQELSGVSQYLCSYTAHYSFVKYRNGYWREQIATWISFLFLFMGLLFLWALLSWRIIWTQYLMLVYVKFSKSPLVLNTNTWNVWLLLLNEGRALNTHTIQDFTSFLPPCDSCVLMCFYTRHTCWNKTSCIWAICHV